MTDALAAAFAWLDEADRLGFDVMAYRTKDGGKGVGMAYPETEPDEATRDAFFIEYRRIGNPAIFDALARRMVADAGGPT